MRRVFRKTYRFGLLGLVAYVFCCSPGGSSDDYDWGLPDGVDPPQVPEDNPQTLEKVELGRYLFYDTQLSDQDNRACGVCHEQAKAFTDTFPRAVGTSFELHPRNTPSLTNVAYFTSMTWIDPTVNVLETQLLAPLLGHDPIIEMGMGGQEDLLLDRLKSRDDYQTLFPLAFPGEQDPFTIENIARAIASFERTIVSWNSAYDRFQRGELDAISESAIRGRDLFYGDAQCGRCHGGPLFNATTDEDGEILEAHGYFNTGLYDIDGAGSYPLGHEGRMEKTADPEDMGSFRTPSLRNVEISRPYMHDGSADTLDHAIRIMAEGGRDNLSGPNVGDGRANRFKSPLLEDLGLDASQLEDLGAFLRSLTDHTFLEDERLASPYPEFVPVFPTGSK